MRDLISIVIPCFKAARFLPDAIESCLGQSYREIEIIVVDDCSPDDCLKIADSYATRDPRVRVVRRDRNGGISRAFNSGFVQAKGRYLTRLAADDFLMPDAIERMADSLNNRERFQLVYCDMALVDEGGHEIHLLPTEEPEKALFPRNRMGVCVMWTREVWDHVGPFDPAYDLAEDYDFWLRASLDFKHGRCPGPPALAYRYHDGQASRREIEHTVAIIRVQLRHLRERLRRHPASPHLWSHLCKGSIRLVLAKCFGLGVRSGA